MSPVESRINGSKKGRVRGEPIIYATLDVARDQARALIGRHQSGPILYAVAEVNGPGIELIGAG